MDRMVIRLLTLLAVLVAALPVSFACRAIGVPGQAGSRSEPTLVGSPAPGAASAGPIRLVLDPVVRGLNQPVFLTHAGDGSGRLFVVERHGRIRISQDGSLAPEPFLDVSGLITSSGPEQGLLGMAFHPRYRENGRFFIFYTARNSDNTIAEYRVSSERNRADTASAAVILALPDFASNHNGGMLAFGPDGFLYAGTGDGGGGGDPRRNGQNRNTLLGKMLRLDIDRGRPYAVPASNPFVGVAEARGEIWSWGLRNPWRFSFDRQTGDLWIGDVGQNQWEEINFQPANSKGGENYGWNRMEGAHCFEPSSGCDTSGLVMPAVEYDHSNRRCAAIGGYVYRGRSFPSMTGSYIYADECSGEIWSLVRDGSGWRSTELLSSRLLISSFGEDEAGELYALALSEGTVYRLTSQ